MKTEDSVFEGGRCARWVMPDSDSHVKREWEAADALWRRATTSSERASVEQKFIQLEKRWALLVERKREAHLTDRTHLDAVQRIAADVAAVNGFAVTFWSHARHEPGESYSDVRLWDLLMTYGGVPADFDEAKWDKLLERINEELRRSVRSIDWRRSRAAWNYDPETAVTGSDDDDDADDDPPRKQFIWAIDVWIWDGPPARPR